MGSTTLSRLLVRTVLSLSLAGVAQSASANLLTNPDFDTDVAAWDEGSQGNLYEFEWKPEDVAGAANSGSGRIQSKLLYSLVDDLYIVRQCVSLEPNRTYDLTGSIFIPTDAQASDGENHPGRAALRAVAWSTSGCPTGSDPAVDQRSSWITNIVSEGDQSGSWQSASLNFVSPAGSPSAAIVLVGTNTENVLLVDGLEPFDAHFDDLSLTRRFADLALTLSPRSNSTSTNTNVIIDASLDHLGPGTEPQSNRLISVAIPSGLSFAGAPNCDGSATANAGVVEWTVPSINAGQTRVCDLTFSVPTDQSTGTVTFAGQAFYANDRDPANNTAQTTVTIEASEDIDISMEVHRNTFSTGDVLRLDLLLSNSGNVRQFVGDRDVEIALPLGFDFPPEDEYPFFQLSDCDTPSVAFDSGSSTLTWTPSTTLEIGEATRCRIAVTTGQTSGDIVATYPVANDEVDVTNNVAFQAVTRVSSSDFFVTSTAQLADDNPGDGICRSVLLGVCTLPAAIEEANASAGSDRVFLESETYTLAINPGLQLVATESVDLIGEGAANTIIRGVSGSDGVITIDASDGTDVVLRELTIADGTRDHGAGIQVLDGTGSLTLIGVTVRDNVASSSGGAIRSDANLAVLGTRIENNQADANGGGIFFSPGTHQGLMVVRDSTINANVAENGGGMAVVPSGGAPFTLEALVLDSTISGNEASNNGGGIIAFAGGTMYVFNSTVSGNEAERLGAGVYVGVTSHAELWNATIAKNVFNSFFAGGGGGGGIWIDSISTARARNSVLVGNGYNGVAFVAEAFNCGGTALELANVNVLQIDSFATGADPECSVSGDAGQRLEASYAEALSALTDFGGPTQTHQPLSDGPLIDAGLNCQAASYGSGAFGTPPFQLNSDQRGEARITDGDGDATSECDVGAVERSGSDPVNMMSVVIGGSGSGSVTSSPVGISCPGTCESQFSDGITVNLTATPDTGQQFVGWSGACTGTGGCSVTMDRARSITATFESTSPTYPVDIETDGNGNGVVLSTPAGIDCPGDCSEDFNEGETVTLSAIPAPASAFLGWSADCAFAGTGACQLTVDQPYRAIAIFGDGDLIFLDGFE